MGRLHDRLLTGRLGQGSHRAVLMLISRCKFMFGRQLPDDAALLTLVAKPMRLKPTRRYNNIVISGML